MNTKLYLKYFGLVSLPWIPGLINLYMRDSNLRFHSKLYEKDIRDIIRYENIINTASMSIGAFILGGIFMFIPDTFKLKTPIRHYPPYYKFEIVPSFCKGVSNRRVGIINLALGSLVYGLTNFYVIYYDIKQPKFICDDDYDQKN